MLPFTPKWFKAKDKQKLEDRKNKLEYKMKRMLEVAKMERECGKHNIVCALTRRLGALDTERDEIKKQIKAIDEGHSPYLS
jgi:hypothetical protein